MLRLVLASRSPARLATLRAAGVEPLVRVSGVDEDAVLQAAAAERGGLDPVDAVLVLARAKAEEIVRKLADDGSGAPIDDPALLVGCDSMLELDGEVLGKPADAEDARARWRSMRGRAGVLHTGHWLVDLRAASDGGTGTASGATSSTTVHFADLTDDEIDAVKLETRKTLELTQFVGACEINPLYFEKPYYMVPADDLAEDAFRVIRDALKQTGKVGLGQLALRGQEYLVAVKPSGKGLLLETLRYEEELREADPYFAEIPAEKADPDLLEVATALIDKKTDEFDASAYKDHYVAALRELIGKKLKNKGKRVTADEDDTTPAKPQKSNVIDLMAALKSSLEGGGNGKAAAAEKPAAKSRATKTTAASKSRNSKSTASKSTAAKKPKSAAAPRKKAS